MSFHIYKVGLKIKIFIIVWVTSSWCWLKSDLSKNIKYQSSILCKNYNIVNFIIFVKTYTQNKSQNNLQQGLFKKCNRVNECFTRNTRSAAFKISTFK